VKLWDLSTGVERMTLTGHKANVEGLAFRSDGRALVTFDRIDVRLWDLSSRGELWKVNVGAQTSNGPLAMSADDKWIIHPDDREHVVLRDASTGNLEQTLAGHGRHVSALAFHPDNDRFISGSEDGSIRLWSRKQQGTITTLDAHRQTVNDVSFNRDGSRIVSAGQDHAVYVWDTETGQELIALKGSQESVEQVAFGTDDVTLAVLNRSGKMRLFEARPQRGELSFRAESVVSSINYHPDGDRIVTGSADGVIQLWDAETGRQVMRLVEHRYPVTSVNFISRGTPELVTTLGDPVEAIRQVREGEFLLKRWDLITGKPKLNVFAHQYSITRSAVSPNGKLIATTSLDGTCCIWDAQHGGLIRALKVSLPLIDTAFHPTLPVLAIACVDKKIRLFEYETGKVLAPLEGHTNPVISLEFSRDGTQLLSAASELDLKKQGKGIPGEVIVWDWENRAERFRLEGLRDAVFQTRFNPQGTIIGTVGGKLIEFDQGGGELKLWNAANGELIRDYAEQNGVAFGIAFSPNGKRFVVGGADRVVHVWDIPPEFVPPE